MRFPQIERRRKRYTPRQCVADVGMHKDAKMSDFVSLGQAAARVVDGLRKISDPGIFYDFPVDDYFDDPCPAPSLTQSIAKILIDRSPRHAWCAHPRLNPHLEHEDERKFDLGTTCHKMLTGRGPKIIPLDFLNWQTKASKEAREEAINEGCQPILREQYDRAIEMRDAAIYQLRSAGHAAPFEKGSGEVVMAAQDEGIWLRTMIDWMEHAESFYDYKSTGMSVAPHALPMLAANAGWDVQAAFHERIIDLIDPNGMGRRTFRFIAQETEPPFAISVMEMSEHWLTIGRKKVQAAFNIWADCTRRNLWPSYPTDILHLEYPGWREARWLDREMTEFSASPKMLADLSGG